ncbi:MAG: hypothetical protein ACK5MT_00485 [Actinomycetales bacterium]
MTLTSLVGDDGGPRDDSEYRVAIAADVVAILVERAFSLEPMMSLSMAQRNVNGAAKP